MVKNTRKALHTGKYKSINNPVPVLVKEDKAGFPIKIGLPEWHVVTAIGDHWRIDDEWWRSKPVSRIYYDVHLDSGQQMMLYRDLITGRWYRQLY